MILNNAVDIFSTFKNIGIVELVSDFVVCEEGMPLSPEAARTLVNQYS